jgi:cyclase
MKRRNLLIIIASIVVVLITAAFIVIYPFYRFYFGGGSKNLGSNLTIVQGGGGNSGILVTDSAVVVIDTKMGSDAEKLHDTAVRLAGNKKIIVINTHYHGDHTKGNHLYKGSAIYIGDGYDKKFLLEDMGAENMPNSFVKDSLVLNLGNETVAIYNFGRAHTWDDLVVLLKNRKVLFTGDLVFHKVNPYLGADAGADVPLWLATLDRIIAMPGVDTLVPGHGEPGGKEMAVLLKTYFTDMTKAANDPLKEKEIIAKYKDWMAVPMAMTPEKTIGYIRK